MPNIEPYRLHITTEPALQQMRAHKDAYETTVGKLSIVVLPGVWSPAYDWSARFMINNFPDVANKDILELGCGSGVISLHAALSGAKTVRSVDINPKAVENTGLNFEKHRVANAQALFSDGFSAVEGEFDVIVFNAPYHGCKPGDLLEYACADEDYRTLRGFFRDASDHLRKGGKLLVGFSESGDLELFRSLIKLHDFRVCKELSEWHEGYNCMIFEIMRSADTEVD